MMDEIDLSKTSDIKFRGCDPGAVKYGNFINYYQFHPPEQRIEVLPTNIWNKNIGENSYILDIGCNAGNLTQSIYAFLIKHVGNNICKLYGIDIDPMLIKRAKKYNKYKNNCFYHCIDVMKESGRKAISNFLPNGIIKYNFVFCFSVLMWIHLNNGDEGLQDFLKYLCSISNTLIIELQPWKCYTKAVRRMKKSNDEFILYKSLKIRNNVENEIERIIEELGFVKIFEDFSKEWNRKILIFETK